MKRRFIVPHPPGPIPFGVGGPDDQKPPPVVGRNPHPPAGSNLQPRLPGDPTKAISDALGAAVQKFVHDVLPAGEILLGAVLVVVGLLLATGLAGKGAKVGAFVATRGAIK